MRLYVNIDHVATVREARKTTEPDPVEAAHAALRGGADGITVHLREDRRHIQDADVRTLAAQLTKPLNLELAAAAEIVRIAEELRPHQATLVPERRLEITTEGGLDIGRRGSETDARLRSVIERLAAAGVRVSLFLDPDRTVLDRAAELGVAAVELHTGEYANTWPQADRALARLVEAAHHTAGLGMAVHAGHGLTYRNVMQVAAIPQIEELNIGHSIVSRSVMTGIEQAVRDMRRAVDAAR
jgi:pyridoxine 5-phosphate synthase